MQTIDCWKCGRDTGVPRDDDNSMSLCRSCESGSFDEYDDPYEYVEPDWCDGCGRILPRGQKCTATDCPESMMLGTNWL